VCAQQEEAAKLKAQKHKTQSKRKGTGKQQTGDGVAASLAYCVEKLEETEAEHPQKHGAMLTGSEGLAPSGAQASARHQSRGSATADADCAAVLTSSSTEQQQQCEDQDVHDIHQSKVQQATSEKGELGIKLQQQLNQLSMEHAGAQGSSTTSSSSGVATGAHDHMKPNEKPSTDFSIGAGSYLGISSNSCKSSSRSSKGDPPGPVAAAGAECPNVAGGAAEATLRPPTLIKRKKPVLGPLAGEQEGMLRCSLSVSAAAGTIAAAEVGKAHAARLSAGAAALLPPHLAVCLGNTCLGQPSGVVGGKLPSAFASGQGHHQQQQQMQVDAWQSMSGFCTRPAPSANPLPLPRCFQAVGAEGACSRSNCKPGTSKKGAKVKPGPCVVCWEAVPCVLLLPCRHLVVCEECFKLLHSKDSDCPMCREPVEQHIVVFYG
jgi:hypothetical protein